jgi:4-amino-4-deoxy-L-arabinose transferase-like glycosyltransferase
MRSPFLIFILLTFIVYSLSFGVDTMDVDASQYAEISREMMLSGDGLHLYDRGADYLDKPPFLFWVSSASMKIFGVNNFGYKFPSVLFGLLALLATFRLTKLLYDEVTARVAVAVLATCQGMFLMTNDIRCDTILMAWVITAIWQLQEWTEGRKLIHLVWGSAAIAMGMMTKGPIALIVPVVSFASNWVLRREWRNFLRAEYLLSLAIIAVLLVPMTVGLYQQYDAHPEKGVSGVRFFYWTQSFGRITGENKWKNEVDITFLLQNMFWTFLPSIFLFLPAVGFGIVKLVRQRLRLQPDEEWISTGGFVLSYMALGLSAYQLPHYIFVAFPLAAICTANFLMQCYYGKWKILHKVYQYFYAAVMSLLCGAVVFLEYCVFAVSGWELAATMLLVLLWVVYLIRNFKDKLFSWVALGMMVINVAVSGVLYPRLLQYQVGNTVGRFISRSGIAPQSVFTFRMHDPLNSLHFYAQGVVHAKDSLPSIRPNDYILTMSDGLQLLKDAGLHFNTIYTGKSFKVSELTTEFLNPKTRPNEIKTYYLIKML